MLLGFHLVRVSFRGQYWHRCAAAVITIYASDMSGRSAGGVQGVPPALEASTGPGVIAGVGNQGPAVVAPTGRIGFDDLLPRMPTLG